MEPIPLNSFFRAETLESGVLEELWVTHLSVWPLYQIQLSNNRQYTIRMDWSVKAKEPKHIPKVAMPNRDKDIDRQKTNYSWKFHSL